jgi:hypothetical protein
VEAHSKLNPPVLRHLSIAFGHPSLNFDSTTQRIHEAGELNEHAVSGGLHDPASVLGDLRVYEFPPMSLQLCERAFFVSAHQAAVASHIGGQDGC